MPAAISFSSRCGRCGVTSCILFFFFCPAVCSYYYFFFVATGRCPYLYFLVGSFVRGLRKRVWFMAKLAAVRVGLTMSISVCLSFYFSFLRCDGSRWLRLLGVCCLCVLLALPIPLPCFVFGVDPPPLTHTHAHTLLSTGRVVGDHDVADARCIALASLRWKTM
jgi:hypothetical protein